MELKPGYKQTDVGSFPSEWEIRRLGEIAEIATGNTPPTRDPTNYGHDFPFVSPADMGAAKYIARTQKRLSAKGFSRARRFPKNSVLFVSIGSTIGKCGIASTELTSNQQINAVLPSPSFSSEFVFYVLCLAAPKVQALAGEQAVPIVNKSQFSETQVALPPLDEQRAIAAALSDVDALIGALDRLIAKKRDLKQAAMQQLLTGQTRLPGFSGKWEAGTIGQLGIWLSGGTPSMQVEAYWSGDIPWVSPKDMKVSRLYDAIDHVGEKAIGAGTRLLPAGAILIVVRGMILAHSLPVARIERPMAFNQDIKALVVAPKHDSNFVLWWLTAQKPLLLSKTTESTHGTKRMPTEELFKVRIDLPQLDEQRAIADVLSDMDAEIAALEARRDKTRLLKQGMMQELLTGRTRLV